MENLPFNLADLDPKETTFTLKACGDSPITLCHWSLRVRNWAVKKYTSEGLREIFEKTKIDEIAEMAFFMLKDKTQFEDIDDFLDKIASVQDQINVIKALLGAVGIGEPEFKKIEDAQKKSQNPTTPPDPKNPRPKKSIGAKSTTP